MKKDWEEAKQESEKPKKLFDEGKILESANLGFAKAEGMMAYNYVYGFGGFAVDKVKGFDFATKAANAGDKLGQYMLGCCYQTGWGGQQLIALLLLLGMNVAKMKSPQHQIIWVLSTQMVDMGLLKI